MERYFLEGCVFFLDLIQLIGDLGPGGLDSWDPRKWKESLWKGYPDSNPKPPGPTSPIYINLPLVECNLKPHVLVDRKWWLNILEFSWNGMCMFGFVSNPITWGEDSNFWSTNCTMPRKILKLKTLRKATVGTEVLVPNHGLLRQQHSRG